MITRLTRCLPQTFEIESVVNVYLISGLGADKRVFERLTFDPEYQLHHVEWIKPTKEENLSSYALRLSEQIDSTNPFCLIGVSFGGMVAVEMLRFIKPEKTIIISSASYPSQLPRYFKLKGLKGMLKYLPASVLKTSNTVVHWLFGLTSENEKKLFRQIIADSDPDFMKWAIGQIIQWEKADRENVVHIHGTADRIIPFPSVGVNHSVENGNHFMIYNKAREISGIIEQSL